jgi:hypothetical protein
VNRMGVLFLEFWGTSILTFIVTALIYISISSEYELYQSSDAGQH